MARYFVTRHPGAAEWAQRQGITAELVPHLDLARIQPGDCVMGTLPLHLVAEICARGARFLHLEMELTAAARGEPLSAEAMERAGAHLVPYRVIREG
jgi:CRISPR-associated protein Csx16